MKKKTINVPVALHKKLKVLSAKTAKTIEQIATDAIVKHLS